MDDDGRGTGSARRGGHPVKRRTWAVASMGVAAAMTLAACGSSGSGAASSAPPSGAGASAGASAGAGGSASPSSIPGATLHVVAADYGAGTTAESGKDWWATVITAFNKTYPQIKIDMNVVNWNDVDNQIKTEVQAGNPPDIAQASADWTGLQSEVYPASDVLTSAAKDNLIASFAKQGDIGGTEYGIPWIASSRALVYNKTLFTKAGITSPPTDWAEYTADAQKLKSAGVPEPACIPLGNEEAQAEALIWELGVPGGGFVDSSGAFSMNSAANIKTFQYLDSLVTAGVTNPSPATTNRTAGCWTDFQNGKVGMTNSQPAELPGLIAAKAKSNLDYAFAPEPGENGLAPTTLGVNDWIWAFKTNSNHQAQDKAFLSFVMSDQWQEAFFNAYKLLPITTGASAKIGASNADLKPFLDSLPTDTFYPVNKASWAALNAQIKQIIGQAVSSNPATILDQLQKTATSGS